MPSPAKKMNELLASNDDPMAILHGAMAVPGLADDR